LAGDAAGIATPSERGEGEGINMALKSGILASEAIIKAADTAQEAAPIYLSEMKRVIEVCKTIADDVVFYQANWAERDKVLNELI
jgi:flavin-dependent dehydrogenase